MKKEKQSILLTEMLKEVLTYKYYQNTHIFLSCVMLLSATQVSDMYKAYKFRIYPNTEQEIALAKSFGCCRWYWNYSLNLCLQTYKVTGKGLTRKVIQGLLPGLKKEYPWLTDAYSQCLQVVALNLSTAYKNFFDKRAQLPRFKSKHGRQSISYPANVKFENDYLKLPGKVGLVYCVRHRDFEGTIKTVTISKNRDDKYYASVLVDDGLDQPESITDGKAIGIDLGLTHFCITSNGSKYDNLKHFAKHQRNLKRKQQKLARKQKGSNSRNKARRLVAKVHSKTSRCREDFLHKLSRKIVNENQVIAVENLNVKGMVRNHPYGFASCSLMETTKTNPTLSRRSSLRCGAIARTALVDAGALAHNLAKAISDCGWGMFCTMLKYKAENEGKTYIEVDRFFPSSKTCNVCLNQVGSLPLDIRNWTCEHCQTSHDRDINASINIRNEALRILSLGTSDTANGGDVRRLGGKISCLLDAIPNEVRSPNYIACN